MLHRTTSCFSGEKSYMRNFCLVLISLFLIVINAQAQNGWTNKGNIPTPRAGMTACVIDNKIFVIGGNNGSPNYSDLAVNEVYDPATNTWEVKAPMPAARGFLSSAVVNGIIYAIGGGYATPTNSLYAYNPTTNSWSTKANLLNPRRAAQAGVVDGIIYNI
jgi:N-acetylneuraminic acid mutarotase